MIVLVTDFGLDGPYTGQVKAVICRDAPHSPVIDLFANAPAWNPQATAYLLAAYVEAFPEGAVFLCVVDPGVGGARLPVIVRAGRRWFVGPDNGLFEIVMRREPGGVAAWQIEPQKGVVSATFHGRDVFAPAAARIACGRSPPGQPIPPAALRRWEWPDDLPEIVYIDVYGNAISGVRAAPLTDTARVTVGGRLLTRARTFGEVPRSEPFWYENANGLVEIAVNRGRADAELNLAIGTAVHIER